MDLRVPARAIVPYGDFVSDFSIIYEVSYS